MMFALQTEELCKQSSRNSLTAELSADNRSIVKISFSAVQRKQRGSVSEPPICCNNSLQEKASSRIELNISWLISWQKIDKKVL